MGSDVHAKYLRHVPVLFENNNRDKHVRMCACHDKSWFISAAPGRWKLWGFHVSFLVAIIVNDEANNRPDGQRKKMSLSLLLARISFSPGMAFTLNSKFSDTYKFSCLQQLTEVYGELLYDLWHVKALWNLKIHEIWKNVVTLAHEHTHTHTEKYLKSSVHYLF